MRKIITSAFALLLVGGLSAQTNSQPRLNIETESLDIKERTETVAPVQSQTRGVAFFTEDFANGFDGNNGLGPWEAADSGGPDDIWMMNTAASPAGQFSGANLALTSTTASNGWAIYDCGLFNTPFVGDNQGFLTSPSIDCSARNTVLVDFEQTYRYCCFPTPPITLGVSVDGGGTWTEFPCHADFFATSNVYSGSNVAATVDISCVASQQADVQIRFSYNALFETGYSHYFWGVDDIAMYEASAENDLRIVQVTNGDVFNEWEYKTTPLAQIRLEENGGLQVGAIFENIGLENQTGVTVTVDIIDNTDGSIVNTTVSAPFDLSANRFSSICPVDPDTLYIDTNWEPSAVGSYDVRCTMNSDQELTNTDDDILIRNIAYSDCLFGHDDDDLDVELVPRADADDATQFQNAGYGNFYTAKNEDSEALGALVRFGPETASDFTIELRLYTIMPGEGLNDAVFISTFYDVQAADIPTSANAPVNTYIEFEAEELMEVWVGDPDFAPTYFVAVVNDDITPNALTILAKDRSDTDNSSGRILRSGAGDFVWFTAQPQSPFVRLVVDSDECFVTGPVGLNELDELGVALGQNVPNPAAGTTVIPFSLETSMDINIQIVDNYGRIVYAKDLGKMNLGQHQVEIDASTFAPGIYQYSLRSENRIVTKSMVITD